MKQLCDRATRREAPDASSSARLSARSAPFVSLPDAKESSCFACGTAQHTSSTFYFTSHAAFTFCNTARHTVPRLAGSAVLGFTSFFSYFSRAPTCDCHSGRGGGVLFAHEPHFPCLTVIRRNTWWLCRENCGKFDQKLVMLVRVNDPACVMYGEEHGILP